MPMQTCCGRYFQHYSSGDRSDAASGYQSDTATCLKVCAFVAGTPRAENGRSGGKKAVTCAALFTRDIFTFQAEAQFDKQLGAERNLRRRRRVFTVSFMTTVCLHAWPKLG